VATYKYTPTPIVAMKTVINAITIHCNVCLSIFLFKGGKRNKKRIMIAYRDHLLLGFISDERSTPVEYSVDCAGAICGEGTGRRETVSKVGSRNPPRGGILGPDCSDDSTCDAVVDTESGPSSVVSFSVVCSGSITDLFERLL
jgi:hypothetical protein